MKGTKPVKTPGARELALNALTAVEQEGAYSNLALNAVLERYRPDPREAGLATELVYGTIQRRNTIDQVLDRHISKGIKKLQPWVRSLFRLSAYQLLYLDRIPTHAAVSEAVVIAKRRGHTGISGLVNAVLRKVASAPGKPAAPSGSAPVERIAFEHSHPEWLVKRWIAAYGESTAEQMASANNEPPPVSVRANRLRIGRDDLLAELRREGFDAELSNVAPDGIRIRGGGNLANTPWFRNGQFTMQDESSMLVAALVAPIPGSRVLDCCAAPGGKSTHLAELMNNAGSIVSYDVHPHKRELIAANAARLGASIIVSRTGDAEKLGAELPAASFDAVLVDAPCTGFGVIRRKPDIKWTKREEDIADIAMLQRSILDSVHRLVKPGGGLVYSTCTLEADENEGQIERFAADHPEFRLDDTFPGGLPDRVVETCRIGGGMLRVMPHQFGSDGFFMARFVRR